MVATKDVKLEMGYVDLEQSVVRVQEILQEAIDKCPSEYLETLCIDREDDRYDDTYTHIFQYRRPLNKEELEAAADMKGKHKQARLLQYNRLKEEFGE
jgi:hypothetical protein